MKRRARDLTYGEKRTVRAVRIEDELWARIVAEAKRRTELDGRHEIGPSEVLRTLAKERLDNIADELGRASADQVARILEKPIDPQFIEDVADAIRGREAKAFGPVASGDLVDDFDPGMPIAAAIVELARQGRVKRTGNVVWRLEPPKTVLDAGGLEKADSKKARKNQPDLPKCRVCGDPTLGDICYTCAQKESREKRKREHIRKGAPQTGRQAKPPRAQRIAATVAQILADWRRPAKAWELVPELERRGVIVTGRQAEPPVIVAYNLRIWGPTYGVERAGGGLWKLGKPKP
jgi:hypothetical protein